MSLRKFIRKCLSENILPSFLQGKQFINRKSKSFLYHGTRVSPENFSLKDDYNWEDSQVWSGDLPEGYLFLSTDIKEASSYGPFVIPCELKNYSNITFSVNDDNPSKFFDMDYGIDLYKHKKEYRLWEKFENSGKSSLIIKGNSKSTVITNIENVIPRTDLALEFYDSKKTS